MADTPVIPVPQLGSKGWVTDYANKLDLLLAHFFVADYNQTYLYPGQVSSLPRVMEKKGNLAAGAVDELQKVLKSYLSRYYDSVTVEVSIKDAATNQTINAELQLSISISDKGTQRVFGRSLQSIDGKMQSITDLNNLEQT